MSNDQNQHHTKPIDVTQRTGWALEVNFDNIPDWMKSRPFCVWTAELRANGKVNKAPRFPNGGWKLSVNQPELWATYDQVRQTYLSGEFDGIGVLMTKGSGIVGVDVDDWKSKVAEHPSIYSALCKLIQKGGYVETSPSGTGLRAFVKGALIGKGRSIGGLEIYDNVRFLTVTGHRLEALDVNAI
jgi:putative DNA primase/helicase